MASERKVNTLQPCLSLLVSSLLSPATSSFHTTAAIIDTTGNVDVLRIYTLILYRLRNQPGPRQAFQSSLPGGDDLTVEDLAAKVLDRVKIMRVFDVIGVMEAINEIRNELDGTGKRGEVKRKESPTEELVPKREDFPLRQKRTVVADSEDEDDEMLFDVEEPENMDSHASFPETETQTENSRDAPAPNPLPTSEKLEETEISSTGVPRTSFILIDNLAHIITPVLRKDYVHGRFPVRPSSNPILIESTAHTLSHALLRSLSTLTKTNSLHTLLLNPTSFPYSPKPRPEAATSTEPTHHQRHRLPPPPPSIFSSNAAIPALTGLLSPYLDMHLLVSKMPKRKADARKLASLGEDTFAPLSGEKERRHGVQMAWVVEVLMDRCGGRTEDWGSFDVGDGGVMEL